MIAQNSQQANQEKFTGALIQQLQSFHLVDDKLFGIIFNAHFSSTITFQNFRRQGGLKGATALVGNICRQTAADFGENIYLPAEITLGNLA